MLNQIENFITGLGLNALLLVFMVSMLVYGFVRIGQNKKDGIYLVQGFLLFIIAWMIQSFKRPLEPFSIVNILGSIIVVILCCSGFIIILKNRNK